MRDGLYKKESVLENCGRTGILAAGQSMYRGTAVCHRYCLYWSNLLSPHEVITSLVGNANP